ncbi:glycosyltransferase family 2 protein [Chryseobacterium sp. FH2]|uniref:glycosyltransferase family 2 protein n=1 Tax=Chryseobacterium sp. FH2 TaxID=1674291 RepID=UPI00065A965D|nr:glycosyltransferase family A protein [Chryseobacterium sp. FH2]
MKNDRIAVVTPVYNGAHTIERSIRSLLNQTFSSWVSVIVNDGSTDETAKILEKYQDDERFYIINLASNVGRGAARKIALEKVKEINAKYICMLDADDLYYPDKLKWQYDYMELHQDIALLSCSIGYIDDKNNLLGVLETFDKEHILTFDHYTDYKAVPHACSIIRLSEIGNITFDEKLLLGQDQDFMIRMLKKKKYAFIPKIGYLYNRTDSFSFKKYKKSLELAFYAKKKLGLGMLDLLRIYIINQVKVMYVGILCLVGKEKIYLDKIGRPPHQNELQEHENKLILNL